MIADKPVLDIIIDAIVYIITWLEYVKPGF